MLDVFDQIDDLSVLALGDLARYEDPEMADGFVHESDDDLPVRLECLGRRVKVGHPVERLLGRRDVVAERREKDDRRLYRAQIEGAPLRPFSLALRKVVPHEEVFDDPPDLLSVHQEEAAPPAFELEET